MKLCGTGFILAWLITSPIFGQSATPPRAADKPEALPEASWYKRVAMHQGLLTNGRFNIVFIGDSLTEFWSHTGKAAWESRLLPLKSVNCGITADRTENILWRTQHYEFHRAQPKIFVLLMGTNNLAMEPPDKPEEVVSAIMKTVNSLRSKFPAAHILMLELPPNGPEAKSPLRQRIQQTNALLARTSLPPQTHLIPIYQKFVSEADHWKNGLTLDGTHFSPQGYDVLADLIVPKLDELLGTAK